MTLKELLELKILHKNFILLERNPKEGSLKTIGEGSKIFKKPIDEKIMEKKGIDKKYLDRKVEAVWGQSSNCIAIELSPDLFYVYLDHPYGRTTIGSGTKEECEKIKAKKDVEWQSGYSWHTYISADKLKDFDMYD